MIQRIQTVWLLLAAVVMFFVFKLPVAGGIRSGAPLEVFASGNIFMFITSVLLLLIAVVAILMFKNRPNQKRLIWLGILLDIVFLVLMYFEMEKLKDSSLNPGVSAQTFKLAAVFPILYIILLVMAYNGIRRDEKLIKSVDRLR